MAWTNRNIHKTRFEQTEEELQKALETKLQLLAKDAYREITLHWRIKGHDKQFELTRDELTYLIRWIEDMDIKTFMRVLKETFLKFNVEMFNTAGWLETVHEDLSLEEQRHPERLPDNVHVDKTLPGHGAGRAVFDSEQEASEFREYKKKKNILRDAFEGKVVGRG